jgi:hypothetical protein
MHKVPRSKKSQLELRLQEKIANMVLRKHTQQGVICKMSQRFSLKFYKTMPQKKSTDSCRSILQTSFIILVFKNLKTLILSPEKKNPEEFYGQVLINFCFSEF